MIAIGADPGVSGAISAVRNGTELLGVYEMPVLRAVKSAKVVRSVDGAGVARVIREVMAIDPQEYYACVIEQTSSMPGQGVASTFSMGHSRGVVEGVVQALGLPLTLVTPTVWKKQMKLTSDKEFVRAHIQRLFPSTDLSRKKDHDKAEAIALALWLYRDQFA